MADKAISDLSAATDIQSDDSFVLEQNGTAKRLTGQTLLNWLTKAADGHGGIKTIEKQGTSGLKDTYRITMADTTTFDFVVTNGKAISSVKQTAVSGLTRTYTITFNDGTSQTFTVTDGRSITGIEKTKTNLLTDTYTITFNDGTTSTFTVANGRGVNSFSKVSSSGLTDTYRIEYNDGTFDEFTVENGEKGDKGDNTYTHIKFAAQKPTAESNSMGDIPDNWVGFYWGSSEEAPEDWQQYKWFEIKGQQGDPGAAATLVSFTVEYQTSDSGTIIPSGVWSASVPVVAQGRYLWTRTTIAFNTGSPVVSYSVSRMGLDGSGSVSSVANISPDANGNVPLTAKDVGALPSTGGDMIGSINMNGQPINGLNMPTEDDQAANKGYVDQTRSITQGGTGATEAEAGLLNLGGCKIGVIWENASPSSAFDAQRITVEDVASYSLFIFECANSTTASARTFTFARKGIKTACIIMANLNSANVKLLFTSRAVLVSDNGYIDFESGYSRFSDEAASERTDRAIPIRVYGIKGVITT